MAQIIRVFDDVRIFIIGNGFDLGHGLPTRYSDFLEYLITQKSDNIWFKYFNNIKIGKNGIDLESELARVLNYIESMKLDIIKKGCFDFEFGSGNKVDFEFFLNLIIDIFGSNNSSSSIDLLECNKQKEINSLLGRREFQSLILDKYDFIINKLSKEFKVFKELLSIYLNQIMLNFTEKIPLKEKFNNEFISNNKSHKENKLIFNFNYTDTIEKYFKNIFGQLWNTSVAEDFYHTYYLHGSLENKKIVLGSDEIENSNSSLFFLRKNYQIIINVLSIDFGAILSHQNKRINEIIVMGNSVSETDGGFYKKIINIIKKYEYDEVVGKIFIYDQNEKSEKIKQLINLDKEYFQIKFEKKQIEGFHYSDYDEKGEE